MSSHAPGKPLVTVSVFLFGKPAWETEGLEGSFVDLELLNAIASCGRELDKRLTIAAELGKRLIASGWEGYGLVYDIEFFKATTLRKAEEELKVLGIAPEDVSMREEVEDPKG